MRKPKQQGDVFMVPVDEIPAGAEKVKVQGGRLVLAEGEVTGHAHVITDTKAATMHKVGDKLYVSAKKPVEVTHEEHGTVKLPKGTWEVSKVLEFDHFAMEAREVAD